MEKSPLRTRHVFEGTDVIVQTPHRRKKNKITGLRESNSGPRSPYSDDKIPLYELASRKIVSKSKKKKISQKSRKSHSKTKNSNFFRRNSETDSSKTFKMGYKTLQSMLDNNSYHYGNRGLLVEDYHRTTF